MTTHRLLGRRQGVRPTSDSDGRLDRAVARGITAEESFYPEVDQLPMPEGGGAQATTSDQSFQELVSYEVPPNSIAKVDALVMRAANNGEVVFDVNGVRYGPHTGAGFTQMNFDEAYLLPGYRIEAKHRSTNGNAAQNSASIVISEV